MIRILGILGSPSSYKISWIFLAVVCCSVTGPEDCATKNNYPTNIAPLSSAEIEDLQSQFNAFSNGQLCSHEFNSYGVIQQASICRTGGVMTQGTEALMITRAKELVVRLSEFTHVSDTSLLAVQRNAGIGVSTERMLVVFKNQVYNGFEVMDTEISVQVYKDGARAIHGGWQERLIIPDCESLTEADARVAAMGTEIIWWGWGGRDTVTVSEENISDGAVKVVVPIIEDKTKKLRLAWRFSVSFGWYLYIDMFNGKVLRTDQLFVT